MPPRQDNNVVFPHPLGPNTITSDPAVIFRSRPSMARIASPPPEYSTTRSLMRRSPTTYGPPNASAGSTATAWRKPAKLANRPITTAVATGVTFGLERDPGAAPYLRAAAPVVCAAAAATNIQPAQIVSALESANLVATNSSAVLILNASLAIYDTIFESYGSNWVASQPVLQDYLGGVCDGINEGLATSPSLKSKPHLTR